MGLDVNIKVNTEDRFKYLKAPQNSGICHANEPLDGLFPDVMDDKNLTFL